MYSLNNFKLILCSLFLTFGSCANTKANSPKKTPPPRPNILVILCDDLGYSDVGFNGSKDIPTPSIDELAKNGVIFKSAYVTHPFCGPSRTSLMTGRYPHTIGAQFNLPPNSGETIKKGVDLKETFISKVLNDAGYYTGIMGKWHLGSNEGYRPNERGFDDFYGFLGGGHNYFPEQFKAAYKRQKDNGNKLIWDYLHPLEHNGKQVDETEYVTDALSREAIRFLGESSQKKDPFFLYLSYNAPHTPLEAKEEDLKLFQHIKDKKRRTYAAMVYAVDRGVKKVVEKLKETNQFENTLIVFFSDNGGKTVAGATNNPLREGKGSACEGGYRVPMFFHWPNVVPAGKVTENPISALDFYPTFAYLAGAKIPDGKKLDGKNIWKDFLAENDSYKNEYIYVMRHRTKFSDVGVRKNQFKALKIYNQTWKLYDVVKDKGEKLDISSKHPEILKDLVNQAEQWSKTHKGPEWWHDKETGIKWREEKMPHFENTFKIK